MVFSQAMVNHNHVSPKFDGSNNWMIGNVKGGEAGPEEDMVNIGSEGEGEEGEMEEGRRIRGKKLIKQPTKEEYDVLIAEKESALKQLEDAKSTIEKLQAEVSRVPQITIPRN